MQYFSIGQFVAVFGLKGELVLRHHLEDKEALSCLTVLFLEEAKGSFLPYFAEKIRPRGAGEAHVKLEVIDTPERAKQLMRKEVWLAEADFQLVAKSTSPIGLLGYHLLHDGVDLGEVVEVIEQAGQVLCKIIFKGKEVLVPVHGETLERIDNELRQVHVHLPDGLLDIYLQ